jgi:hypothetical protein
LAVFATNKFMKSCSILMPPMCQLLLLSIVFFDRFRVLFGHVLNENFQVFMRNPRMTLVRFAPVESKT